MIYPSKNPRFPNLRGIKELLEGNVKDVKTPHLQIFPMAMHGYVHHLIDPLHGQRLCQFQDIFLFFPHVSPLLCGF